MKERGPDPRALELRAFCKAEGRLHGLWPLVGMPRLAASFSAASDGDVAWSAHGHLRPVAGGEAEIWLSLQAQAEAPLQCQRCLQTMKQPLRVAGRLRFVRGEDEAARLDEESEDDVLELPPRLDLHDLVEEELILALPLVPRHDNCPEPLAVSEAPAPGPAEAAEEAAPHPFAALAALRRRPADDTD